MEFAHDHESCTIYTNDLNYAVLISYPIRYWHLAFDFFIGLIMIGPFSFTWPTKFSKKLGIDK